MRDTGSRPEEEEAAGGRRSRPPARRAGPRAPAALRPPAPADTRHLTAIFFTAEVFEAPAALTRTRSWYVPFLAGAFHFSE